LSPRGSEIRGDYGTAGRARSTEPFGAASVDSAMRPILLFPALLLAGCGEEAGSNNGAAAGAGATVQTATLTGLYESGPAERRNQMCVIESGGSARFGLVVWTGADQGCSGTGTAVRSGNVLRLTMAGSEDCSIEARVEGTRLIFPPTQPPGCPYYCSPGARFAGAILDKTGGGEADARRAQDLVGGRLCG
jgi:hypothetical protein